MDDGSTADYLTPSYNHPREVSDQWGAGCSDWKRPGAYRCARCGNLYRWKKNLSSHRRLECGKEPQHQCPFCTHRTKHRSSLTKHIARLHPSNTFFGPLLPPSGL
ncbi:hypothetical protein PR048_000158 [Dryococelus australis]|uniref:C2H2-type domain-containing protein n=1 Tax=Dryococelus australis TaxID=614101 RepID=A0ABQ9IDW4_9NEOP|nr:hypothetical protein PR048_000158 [Dryococelus australis]